MTHNEYADSEYEDSEYGYDDEQSTMNEISGGDKETNNWAMILHLSTFAGYAVPLAGLIAPIVIWQVKKDQLPGLDAHGKMVTNFIISILIYTFVAFALCFVIIGFLLLPIVGLIAIIFPIIGAVKASEGIVWKYPFMLNFF